MTATAAVLPIPSVPGLSAPGAREAGKEPSGRFDQTLDQAMSASDPDQASTASEDQPADAQAPDASVDPQWLTQWSAYVAPPGRDASVPGPGHPDGEGESPLPPAGAHARPGAALSGVSPIDDAARAGPAVEAPDDPASPQAPAEPVGATTRHAPAAHDDGAFAQSLADAVPTAQPARAEPSALPGMAPPGQPTPAHDAPAEIPGRPAHLHGEALRGRLDEALRWMAGNGVQTAHLRIEPESLGPIAIHLRIEGDVANVMFTSIHESTRQALQSSLDNLRDALAAGNLNLGQASVGGEQPHHQGTEDNASGGRRAQHDPAFTLDGQPDPATGGASTTPMRRGNGLVSLYA